MALPKDSSHIETVLLAALRKTMRDGEVIFPFPSSQNARNFRFRAYDVFGLWRKRAGSLPADLQAEGDSTRAEVMLSLDPQNPSRLIMAQRANATGIMDLAGTLGQDVAELQAEISKQDAEAKAMSERLLKSLDGGEQAGQEGEAPPVPSPDVPYPLRRK